MQIFSPLARYKKYHLCITLDCSSGANRFLFLNSDDAYADTYSVSCDRVPCIPASDTGVTAFSFSMIPRYSDAQLSLYQAKKLGEIEKDVAAELLKFVHTVKSLAKKDKELVRAAIAAMM